MPASIQRRSPRALPRLLLLLCALALLAASTTAASTAKKSDKAAEAAAAADLANAEMTGEVPTFAKVDEDDEDDDDDNYEYATGFEEPEDVVADDPAVEHDLPLKLEQLPRYEWMHSRAFIEDCAIERQPKLLSQTMATLWPAFQKWNWPYLKSRKRSLRSVQQSSSRYFVSQAESVAQQRFLEIPGLEAETVSYVNVSLRRFSRLARAGDSLGFRMYYEGDPKAHWGYLNHDLEPAQFHQYKDDLINSDAKDATHRTVVVEFQGVRVQARQESSHNLVTVLQGSKRFFLFPPSQLTALYPFPHLHPSFGQSMVNFSQPDLDRFPNFLSAVGNVTEVKRGDTLYIPPLWFYTSLSIEPTLSVNHRIGSNEAALFDLAMKIPQPWASNLTSVSDRSVVYQMYLKLLLPQLRFIDSARDFMKTLLASRYQPYMEELKKNAYLRQGFACMRKRRHFRARLHRQFREGVEESVEMVKGVLDHVALNEGTQLTLVGNFVEEIARAAVGTDNSFLFIKRCF